MVQLFRYYSINNNFIQTKYLTRQINKNVLNIVSQMISYVYRQLTIIVYEPQTTVNDSFTIFFKS